MPSRKLRRKDGAGWLKSGWRSLACWTGPYALSLCRGLGIFVLVAGSLWGLHESEGAVLRWRGLVSPVEFDLLQVPAGLETSLRNSLQDLQSSAWDDPTLCRLVHSRLSASGWVERVDAVGKSSRGTVYVECRYRQPLAPVQHGEYFYLVDESGFRLPGRYTPGSCDRILIRGVSQAPPEPWGPWEGADLAAAVRLTGLLARQPFSHQIDVLNVDNYAGRLDRRRVQIELIADNGARILWGSPPGDELEENSVEQKINILLANYRHHKRIDAQHAVIDVSIFPDRYIVPGSSS